MAMSARQDLPGSVDTLRIAIFLDMENVPAAFIEPAADLGDTFGRVCHLAVYADWRQPGNRAAWGTTLHLPIQQHSSRQACCAVRTGRRDHVRLRLRAPRLGGGSRASRHPQPPHEEEDGEREERHTAGQDRRAPRVELAHQGDSASIAFVVPS
jgi:hypothetical protein